MEFLKNSWLALLLTMAAAYLLGSVNSAIIVTKIFAKDDIRRYGSGNAGATNVLRSQGKLPALITTVGDLLKSFLSVLAGGWLMGHLQLSASPVTGVQGLDGMMLVGQYLAGFFCIIGHLYPLYFGFRGGKGVMTTLGMMLILDWRVALICLGFFILAVLAWRMVSLGSVIAASLLPVFTFVFRMFVDHKADETVWFCTAMSLLIAAILVIKHIPNIKRIIHGTESRLGKKTVELRGVSKSFEGRQVLRDFDCMLLRDDRIGIVGVNGSGKSTLLNLIAGCLSPDQGEVIVGETVKIGYFSQENPPMDGGTRVIDYVKEIGERIETVDGVITASQLLEQFLFPADVQWSPIDKLSGGEKRRLFLLSILASAPNILLLDEPTNDLDIETLTILEDYLETFPGAVVAVSHDRYFLDKVARRIFVVEGDGRVTPYAGGYTDYLAALAERRRAEKKAEKPAPKKEESRPSAPKKLKFSYKEQREYETIDADIAALEEQLADNQAQQSACGSDYVALQRLQEEQSQLESALEEKMERWVYLNDLAERIAAQ